MNYLRLSISTLLLSIVAACGGAGGDNGVVAPDSGAIEAVEPLVGVWDLPGDWNGTSGDEAYLLIKSPNTQGVAEATIYDFDDAVGGAERNCFLIDGDKGEIRQSLNNELFLEVPAYTSAVVILKPNGEMQISIFAEDAVSGAPPERVLIAERLGLTENELELC